MKLNGQEFYEGMGDYRHFLFPKIKAGEKVKLLYSDEEQPVPGCRRMKKGIYDVIGIDTNLSGDGLVYVLRKLNSKYEFRMNHIAVDKAIIAGAITTTK